MQGSKSNGKLKEARRMSLRELNLQYNDFQELSGIWAMKNVGYQRLAFFFSSPCILSRNRDASRLSCAHAGVVTSYRLGEVSSFPHMAPEAL